MLTTKAANGGNCDRFYTSPEQNIKALCRKMSKNGLKIIANAIAIMI